MTVAMSLWMKRAAQRRKQVPFTLSKEFRFEAAHALTHLPPDHKCFRTHGHSYRVELVLWSNYLDNRGFASVDYSDLDLFKDYLNETFDHRFLNEVVGSSQGTTAESLAHFFYIWCKATWPNTHAVRVYETENTCVEYSEAT
jgi:6-pyruvoyltetrahydropterin/6-carboxytetrahydropterin synthase